MIARHEGYRACHASVTDWVSTTLYSYYELTVACKVVVIESQPKKKKRKAD